MEKEVIAALIGGGFWPDRKRAFDLGHSHCSQCSTGNAGETVGAAARCLSKGVGEDTSWLVLHDRQWDLSVQGVESTSGRG